MKSKRKILSSILSIIMVMLVMSSYQVNLLARTEEKAQELTFNYKPSDVLIDPNNSYIYLTDGNSNCVHRFDYVTGQVVSISVGSTPERMTINNSLLYVTLLKQSHSPYIFDEDQEGAIAIIDLNSFSVIDQFDVAIDPYDIEVKDGYIYISSGSGQHTKLKSYSLSTKEEVAFTGINDAAFIEMHPRMDRIYAFSSKVSPIDAYGYNIADGKFVESSDPGGYDSIYHGEYRFSDKFAISPDGQYIYNYSGAILKCDESVKNDMRYTGALDESFNAIAFDLVAETVYTATDKGVVNIYDYTSSSKLKSIKVEGNPEYLFFKDQKLIGVIKENSRSYTIKEISIPQGSNDEKPQLHVMYLPEGISVSDSVFSLERPEIYIADKTNSKLHLINYNDYEITEVPQSLPPERITLYDDIIVMTLLKMSHNSGVKEEDQKGAIMAVLPENPNECLQIDIDIDPFDIAIDKNGYICISSGSGQWTSIKLYAEDVKAPSSASIRHKSFIEYNPVLNKVYAVNTDVNPRGLSAYKLSKDTFEGKAVSWPHHGQYGLTPFIKVSPDGQYLFNGSGVIVKCSENEKEDMKFVTRLDKSFTDVTFDLDNNTFYTGYGKCVYVYDYKTFKNIGIYSTKGEVVSLTYKDGNLIVLSKADNGQYLIEKSVK
jgi:glutamine cyclotransferase